MISDIVLYFHRLITWLTLRTHLPYDMYICTYITPIPLFLQCASWAEFTTMTFLHWTVLQFFTLPCSVHAPCECATSCAEINKFINLEPLEVIWGPLWSIERRLRPCFATSASTAQLISAQFISAQLISAVDSLSVYSWSVHSWSVHLFQHFKEHLVLHLNVHNL